MTRGSVSRPSRSTAPGTARSASRLCGGILDGRSTGDPLVADDVDPELRRDVLVQPHRDRGLAERLDRLLEAEAPPLPLDAVAREEVDDVRGGHGADHLALLGGLPPLLVHERLDAAAERLGIALDPRRLGVLLRLDVVEVLQIAGGGAGRELLRGQEVPRVPVGDLADLPAAPDLRDVVQQDDLHGLPSYSVAMYVTSATLRPR